MNNYDDIKRFKEKLNMEGIDYKEIAENHAVNTNQNWAIIKQIATADEPFHPLEHGSSTQPTPTPISKREFSASPLNQPEHRPLPWQNHQDAGLAKAAGELHAPAAAVEQSFNSPLMSALSKAFPLASPPEAPVTFRQPPSPPVTAPDNGRRFNQLFSRKPGSLAGITSTTPARDISLSLLLEKIALCR